MDITWNTFNGIKTALICIPKFIQQYVTSIDPTDYATSPPFSFNKISFSIPILNDLELSRVNLYKTRKKQFEWIAGRFATKKLYQQYLAPHIPLDQILIGYENKGRPYLVDHPQRTISVSHSSGYAIAGICLSEKIQLGIDIEKIKNLDFDAIFRVGFSDREIQDMDYNNLSHSLFTKWTCKEAFLKYLGLGFHEPLKKIEIIGEKIYYHGNIQQNIQIISQYLVAGYMFSIVYSKNISKHSSLSKSI